MLEYIEKKFLSKLTLAKKVCKESRFFVAYNYSLFYGYIDYDNYLHMFNTLDMDYQFRCFSEIVDGHCTEYYDIDNASGPEVIKDLIRYRNMFIEHIGAPLALKKFKIFVKNACNDKKISYQVLFRTEFYFENTADLKKFVTEFDNYIQEQGADFSLDLKVYLPNQQMRLLGNTKFNDKYSDDGFRPFIKDPIYHNESTDDKLFLCSYVTGTELIDTDSFIFKQEKEKIIHEPVTHDNFDYIFDLIDLIDDSRSDDRDTWRNCIWSICSETIMDEVNCSGLVHKFSQKSHKYDRKATNQLIRDYKSGFWTIGTLKEYARTDNPDGYKDWSSKYEKKKDDHCLDPISTDDDYDSVKAKFELTHFKCISTGLYYEIDDKINIRNRRQLFDSYEHLQFSSIEQKKKSFTIVHSKFISKWVEDPKIRVYQAVDLYPPPLHCPKNHFNLWTGFAVDNVSLDNLSPEELIHIDNGVNLILEHFQLLFGEECYDYCMNWMALLFQKPGLKVENVIILLKSLQGLGKDIWYRIIENIFGKKYCYKTQKVERDVLGEFNSPIQGKIFLCMDEMNMSLSAKLEDAIKDLVTSEVLNINAKSIKQFDTNNFLHIITFSNGTFPWKLSEDDRRCLGIDRSSVSPKDFDYYNKLFTIINDPFILKTLLNKFLAMDISKFQPKKDRPKTEFMDELKEISRPIELQFLIDFIDSNDKDSEHNLNDLFALFLNYVTENFSNIRYSTSSRKFILTIKKYNIDGFEHKRYKDKRIWSFDIIKCKQWMYNKNYLQPFESLLT
jgi:hypothetical protein